MADRLPREYKEFNWNWVKYAGVIMMTAVAIPLVMAYEIGLGGVATAIGAACICISGMAQGEGNRQ